MLLTIDTVKTRYQTQQMSSLEEMKSLIGGERKYISTWHCVKDTFLQEGFMGMYRGMGVTMIRAFIGILSLQTNKTDFES
jgi:Mitochondrial carrier protein